jgi:hypothetical protein
MAHLVLPPRQPQGDVGNIERAMLVSERLHQLGIMYRARFPKKKRSYRRWCKFIHEHEPGILCKNVSKTVRHYQAAPRG